MGLLYWRLSRIAAQVCGWPLTVSAARWIACLTCRRLMRVALTRSMALIWTREAGRNAIRRLQPTDTHHGRRETGWPLVSALVRICWGCDQPFLAAMDSGVYW